MGLDDLFGNAAASVWVAGAAAESGDENGFGGWWHGSCLGPGLVPILLLVFLIFCQIFLFVLFVLVLLFILFVDIGQFLVEEGGGVEFGRKLGKRGDENRILVVKQAVSGKAVLV